MSDVYRPLLSHVKHSLFGISMAYEDEAAETILDEAKENYQADKEYWSDIYSVAREDAHFLSDDDFAQWDEADYNNRVSSGRPALTIDQLGQFVHQVANDIRINTPTINVIPSGFDSDQKTAEVYKGLIKNIEYSSNADNAYDTAVFSAVKQSFGFIRVDHDYIDGDTFDQELMIKRVHNPFAVYIDRNSIEIDGRDMKHATIIDKICVKEFKEKYPEFEPSCFEDEKSSVSKDDDMITIAEYFCIEEEWKTIGIDDTGNVFEVTEGMQAARTRKVATKTVKRYKLSGTDVLEETTFAGKYVPIVPVYGEENWIDGKRHIFSLIRKSKGAQKMFNYWKSLETELLMKAPQAPIMAAEGQTEDYAADWLNPAKAAVLRYKTTDLIGNPIGAPQRLEPPTIPTGIVNASRGAVDDIKATMGIYGSSLGQRSNETSGVAIAQRKQEGDVATYHFADNLTKAITQIGRILVFAIPEIYDTPRILRIIGMEDEPTSVGVNGEIAPDQDETIDLSKGRYDVKVISGASYTTLRQESVAALQDIFRATPDLMQVMGDLYFKYSDFAGAQAMANRMKKVVDPKFLDKEDQDEIAQDGEQAPDPEKQQMVQIIQEGQQAIQQMQQELQSLQEQLKAQESMNGMSKAQQDLQKQYDALKAQEQIATLKIQSLEKDLLIKKLQYEADLKSQQDAMESALEDEVINSFPEQEQQPEFMGQP